MAGYDGKCPHCNKKIDVDAEWAYNEYSTEFMLEHECGKRVSVLVEMTPLFRTEVYKCQKCNKVEPVNQWYCQKCQDELNALSQHLGGG